MKRPPKKDDTLEVRLPQETKQAFMERCRAEGRSASEAVRGFIEQHLARPLSKKELPMFVRPTLAVAASAAVLAVGVSMIAATPSRAAPDFKAIFDELDANHDGRVTRDEITAKPRTGGGVTGDPTGKARGSVGLSAGFEDMDANRDGSIAFAEFEAFNMASVKQAFLRMDANGDGKITLVEVRPTPAGAQAKGLTVTGPPEGFFVKFDKNRDGALTEAEFTDWPQ